MRKKKKDCIYSSIQRKEKRKLYNQRKRDALFSFLLYSILYIFSFLVLFLPSMISIRFVRSHTYTAFSYFVAFHKLANGFAFYVFFFSSLFMFSDRFSILSTFILLLSFTNIFPQKYLSFFSSHSLNINTYK